MIEQTSKQYDFAEQGYIIVDDIFSKEDLLAFRCTFQKSITTILERAIKTHPDLKKIDPLDFDQVLLALRYADPNYVAMIQRLISRSPEFFRLTSAPNLVSALRLVLNVEEYSPLYLLSNGIVFTNPHDSENKRSTNFELDWHQDTFFTIPRSRYVQFWGPVLHDSTKDIGTLIICPGSHKAGYGKQCIRPDLSFNHRYSMAPGEADKYEHLSIDLQLGQMLIFDGQLIHASGKNISKYVRMTMLGLCHDASREECIPVSTEYRYHGQTPEMFFYEVYQDEKAKKVINQFAVEPEPAGGV